MRQFVGILFGMFGISVMQLILATAMPLIVTEIGGAALYSWVFSGYLLASLLTIPIFAKLADLYGKKQFYLLGMALFAVGTLVGGVTPTMATLVIARIIQGLGAGMIIPVSLALISDLFPAEKRGNMIGVFGLVQLLAILLSPLLGSFITKQWGWHWIFWITLAVVVVATLLVALIKQPAQSTPSVHWREVDVGGGLAFGAFCVLLVTFSNVTSKAGRLELTGVLLLVGAALAALALVWAETHHRNPVIKLAFLQIKVLRSAIISAIITGALMYGLITLLPLCGVILHQQGLTMESSQLLLLLMLGIASGIISGSRLMAKFTGNLFTKTLWGISLVAAALLYVAIAGGYWALFYTVTVVIGLGLGGIMATLLINSQNAVGSADRTVLSGLVQLGRYLGAALGVTLLTGMLPEVSAISGIGQFMGAFGLLVAIYGMGLVNELL